MVVDSTQLLTQSQQTMSGIPQEAQDILDRVNEAIRTNNVQTYIDESRAKLTDVQHIQIDRAVQQVVNSSQRVRHAS